MLKILKAVSSKQARSQKGDVQKFLEQLLVEIVSENYRYFVNELLLNEDPERCWPPLMANERQLSGLFAIGLSRICPFSRPEYSIKRSKNDEDEATEEQKSGRVDFMAFYHNRDIALELKRHAVTTTGDIVGKNFEKKWDTLNKQTKEALKYMKEENFSSPVSVGLLVIRVNRVVFTKNDKDVQKQNIIETFWEMSENEKLHKKVDFLARYDAPAEMQSSSGWGEDGKVSKVFPGIIFAACIWQRMRGRASIDRSLAEQ
jgi:hypothetical protein